MIHYPVKTLINAGIEDILVISNSEHIGKYMELLEFDFDANFNYKVQSEPKGIAHGVSLAEEFVDDKFAVILGDNILLGNISEEIQKFERSNGAKIFLKEVTEPSAYGIAWVEGDKVTRLEEKPEHPDSQFAVIGLYLYDKHVFDVIERIEPSDRGEYEITDVNNAYVNDGSLEYEVFGGKWFDTGTPEGLYKATRHVREERLG